jgi:nucleoside-diphosphate-sugar epimerase
VLALVGELLEDQVLVEHRAAAPGDVRSTLADTSRARADLGFEPSCDLAEGIARQLDWLLARSPSRAAA